jgi:DNA-binding PadR family transcriptional regulator
LSESISTSTAQNWLKHWDLQLSIAYYAYQAVHARLGTRLFPQKSSLTVILSALSYASMVIYKPPRFDTIGGIRASILAVLYDAPYVDYGSLEFLQKRSTLYTTISKMKADGLVESKQARKVDVLHEDSVVQITPRGRLVLQEILYAGRYRGKSSLNEDPPNRIDSVGPSRDRSS